MFQIVCDPSSGSIQLYLTEIVRSGSQMFVVCLVGVWQSNFEPVVCVYGTSGWELLARRTVHTHHWVSPDQLHNLLCYHQVSIFLTPYHTI